MLLLAFCPKILGGGGDLQMYFCSKMNAARVVWTIIGGGDTQNLLADKKKIELYALSGGRYTKTLQFSLAP